MQEAIHIMVSMIPPDKRYLSSDVCYFQDLEAAYRAALHIWKACIDHCYDSFCVEQKDKCAQLYNIILGCIQSVKILNAIEMEAIAICKSL